MGMLCLSLFNSYSIWTIALPLTNDYTFFSFLGISLLIKERLQNANTQRKIDPSKIIINRLVHKHYCFFSFSFPSGIIY